MANVRISPSEGIRNHIAPVSMEVQETNSSTEAPVDRLPLPSIVFPAPSIHLSLAAYVEDKIRGKNNKNIRR